MDLTTALPGTSAFITRTKSVIPPLRRNADSSTFCCQSALSYKRLAVFIASQPLGLYYHPSCNGNKNILFNTICRSKSTERSKRDNVPEVRARKMNTTVSFFKFPPAILFLLLLLATIECLDISSSFYTSEMSHLCNVFFIDGIFLKC